MINLHATEMYFEEPDMSLPDTLPPTETRYGMFSQMRDSEADAHNAIAKIQEFQKSLHTYGDFEGLDLIDDACRDGIEAIKDEAGIW